MKSRTFLITTAIIFLAAGLMAGCSTVASLVSKTHVVSGNPYLAEDNGALVYFIRPNTERPMGAADNPVTVDINEARLLRIDKGEYTLVRLKPMENAAITARNITAWGAPYRDLKEMSRTAEFTFVAGQTYFIKLDMFDGEFRGVHFDPVEIDLETARELADGLRPIGHARSRSIASL